MRRTKIIATIGPSSNDRETITQMLHAGMDVARLNFSHGTHSDYTKTIALLRTIAAEMNRPLTIIQDLQGPKIRTGALRGKEPVMLAKGDRLTITTRDEPGTATRVSTTYHPLPRDVRHGDRILISDGLIELRVLETTADEVQTEIVVGGILREHQGINLPGVSISSPSLTEKDIADLEFGLAHRVDYVALSFVRQASDIAEIKERIAAANKDVPVIAKIEKPEALDDLAGILRLSDGIMVARGDLGVEIPTARVPPVQKMLIQAANQASIPVITATQMLDSMIRNPRPTRAEASDVANAILDGTDAVMLSGETAAGLFPVEAIQMMAQIVEEAESLERCPFVHPSIPISWQEDIPHAISAAAHAITGALSVKAIVAFTQSGNTARLVSHQRPCVPIVAVTPYEKVYFRLNLLWGVLPIMSEYVNTLTELSNKTTAMLLERGLVKPGDRVILTGGHPMASRGMTDFLKILKIRPPTDD